MTFTLCDFEYNSDLERKIYSPATKDPHYKLPYYMYCVAEGGTNVIWCFVDNVLYYPDLWLGMKYIKSQTCSREELEQVLHEAKVGQRVITHKSHVTIA